MSLPLFFRTAPRRWLGLSGLSLCMVFAATNASGTSAANAGANTNASNAEAPKESIGDISKIDETTSQASDRQAVAVTIYNGSLALVREERKITMQQGVNRIAMREVAAQIMPETVSLRSTSGGALTLLEQNFDFDLLSASSLLDKYVGRKVNVIHSHPTTGEPRREAAIVLANNDGKPVLQFADRIETGLPASSHLAFDTVPAQLRDRPTLSVALHSAEGGAQTVDLSYLTHGMDWKADYVATLAADENSLNLAGWVTLTNQSGARFENAKLQLVAGDVARAMPQAMDARQFKHAVAAAAPMAEAMEQEELFEYHLYTLPRPTTIAQNQTKQVALLSAGNVPVRKEYRLQGAAHWYHQLTRGQSAELGDKRKVDVFVEFDNKDGELGMPLPKGIVRVYKADSQQRAQFIGEDHIDHTAKNEKVRLKLGSAFDLNGTWKNTAVEKISDRVYEMEFEIELRNAKEVPATIKVVEPIPGQWTVLQESHPHTKPSANLAQWLVEVPADGKTDLRYKVRVQY